MYSFQTQHECQENPPEEARSSSYCATFIPVSFCIVVVVVVVVAVAVFVVMVTVGFLS